MMLMEQAPERLPVVDELMADETVGSGADTLYALGDHLRTIRVIANFIESTSVTTVTNHRTYNSFGKLVSETNTAVDLIFGYTGKQLDDVTGLQHNLFRWYDSGLGQWLSEDPMGFAAGDENLKSYVGNRVLSGKDPTGLYDDDYGQYVWDTYKDYFKNPSHMGATSQYVFYASWTIGLAAASVAAGLWIAGAAPIVLWGGTGAAAVTAGALAVTISASWIKYYQWVENTFPSNPTAPIRLQIMLDYLKHLQSMRL